MVQEVTRDIKVTVESYYQEEYSNPMSLNYLFAYRVTIDNGSKDAVKLLRRHWYIFDAIGRHKEVEGEGVVGLQPIILSGDQHQYISGCQLHSGMGTMHGTYLIERIHDRKQFYVTIPKFQLIATPLFN